MKPFDQESQQEARAHAMHAALELHTVSAGLEESVQQDQPEDQVVVHWGDILPWLADALASKRSWVEDFAADQLVISRDFHEVLCAYRRYRGHLGRPAADLPVDRAA